MSIREYAIKTKTKIALLGLAVLVSFAAVSAQSESENSFDMIIMADPQPFRVLDKKKEIDSNGEGTEIASKGATSARLNNRQASTIREIRNNKDYDLRGVIINGDLVENPSSSQRKSYSKRYRKSKWKNKTPIFSGLGNHDFGSNWGKPGDEGCLNVFTKNEKNALGYFIKHYHVKEVEKHEKNTDLSVDFDFESDRGSLAYSWEIEDIHFVQLNNYPTMETCEGDITRYTIDSSLVWLRGDLESAKKKNKSVILNFHDCCQSFSRSDRRKFEEIIDDFDNITAVFVGHYHHLIGRRTAGLKTYGKNRVPIFQSGSPIYGRNLLVRFRGGQMEVHKIEYYIVEDGNIYGPIEGGGYKRTHLETIDLK